MRPKVCVFTTHKVNDRRVFRREAMTLRDLGYDVTIIGQGPGEPQTVEGVHLVPIEKRPGVLRLLKFLRSVYRRAMQEPDVAVYHTDDYNQMHSALKILRRTGKPVVLDIHEMYPGGYSERLARNRLVRRLLRWLFRAYENHCARRIRNVILVYGQDRERFEKLGCRVVHIDNYATSRDYDARPVGPGAWAHRANTVVHTGLLDPCRGSDILVELAARFKKAGRPIRMLVSDVTYTPGQQARFRELLARHDTAGVLELVPLMPPEQLPTLIHRASVGLAMVRPEGRLRHAQPTKIFEYMACSVPVVAARWDYSEKLVEQTGAGIVVRDSSDVAEYEQAVLRVLENPDLARQMGEVGRQEFLRHYNWEALVPRMKRFYEDILLGAGLVPPSDTASGSSGAEGAVGKAPASSRREVTG